MFGLITGRSENMKVSFGSDGAATVNKMRNKLQQNAHEQRLELLNKRQQMTTDFKKY